MNSKSRPTPATGDAIGPELRNALWNPADSRAFAMLKICGSMARRSATRCVSGYSDVNSDTVEGFVWG